MTLPEDLHLIGFALFCFFGFLGFGFEYWANKRHRYPGIEIGGYVGLFSKDRGLRPFLRAEDVFTKKGLAYRRRAKICLGLAVCVALLTGFTPDFL